MLDFKRHVDGFVGVDPDAETARAQPGITIARLNGRLAERTVGIAADRDLPPFTDGRSVTVSRPAAGPACRRRRPTGRRSYSPTRTRTTATRRLARPR